MSQVLRDAHRFEEVREQLIRPEERPAFHLSTRVGWMNDPNGFSYYYGKYHMFYQYYPYDSHWGPMHWGHAVSSDLLHWEYLPCAMAPDMPYDRDGVYSGSAITMPDGRQMLMYTGVAVVNGSHGATYGLQTQNLAFGDGEDYEKYEGNPVITGDDLPSDASPYDFRDPKIVRLADGTYRCYLANNSEKGGGQILMFRSDDGLSWMFDKALAKNHDRIGKMWECPDFFELDGTWVLLASSQDMLPKGFEYHNGNGTFYMLGEFDETTETFTEECNYAADYGIDFYAPQTILTPDGRRVMMGWMANWDTCNLHTRPAPWFGQMSLPRELHVRNGRLYETPIAEFDALRKNKKEYHGIAIEGDGKITHVRGEDGVVTTEIGDSITLDGIDGRTIDLTVWVRPVPGEEIFKKFALRFAQKGEFHTGVSFRPHESVLKIDRKFSGSRRAIIHQRRALVNHENGSIKLRLVLDRFSAELFVNDGEKVLSAQITTDIDADGISFACDGKVLIDVEKYDVVI